MRFKAPQVFETCASTIPPPRLLITEIRNGSALLTIPPPRHVVIRRANRIAKLKFWILTLVDYSFQNCMAILARNTDILTQTKLKN
jgi:hypothetical protein